MTQPHRRSRQPQLRATRRPAQSLQVARTRQLPGPRRPGAEGKSQGQAQALPPRSDRQHHQPRTLQQLGPSGTGASQRLRQGGPTLPPPQRQPLRAEGQTEGKAADQPTREQPQPPSGSPRWRQTRRDRGQTQHWRQCCCWCSYCESAQRVSGQKRLGQPSCRWRGDDHQKFHVPQAQKRQ